jgi:hypothetical protein
MVTTFARITNIYKIWKLRETIFSKLYNVSQPNFAILLISIFHYVFFSCGVWFPLLRLIFSLTCKLFIASEELVSIYRVVFHFGKTWRHLFFVLGRPDAIPRFANARDSHISILWTGPRGKLTICQRVRI